MNKLKAHRRFAEATTMALMSLPVPMLGAVTAVSTAPQTISQTMGAAPSAMDTKNAADLKDGVDVAGSGGTTDPTGVIWSEDPTWVLLADSNVTTLDVSKPTVGFGIQRSTPFTILRVSVRKNLADGVVDGAIGDRTFGRALLAPELANLGVGVRFERHFGIKVKFGGKADDLVSGRLTMEEFCAKPGADCHTRTSSAVYIAADAAEATFNAKSSDGTRTVSGFGAPSRLSVGYAYRVAGILPDNVFGSKSVAFSPSVGVTSRFVGGDLSEIDRIQIFGNASLAYVGVEAGVSLELGNIIIDAGVTVLAPGTSIDDRAPGLSGLQFAGKLTFLLPWSVAQGSRPGRKSDAGADGVGAALPTQPVGQPPPAQAQTPTANGATVQPAPPAAPGQQNH